MLEKLELNGYFKKLYINNFCNTVKVSFLARDRECTVPMFITDICQNDRKSKKINTCLITQQERNFHCINKWLNTRLIYVKSNVPNENF